MTETGPELVTRAGRWGGRDALVAAGRPYTYAQLLHASHTLAAALLGQADDLRGARVVFLAQPGVGSVVLQWAIWRAGGVAVPLSSSQAPAEWEYIAEDAQAAIVVGERAAGGTLRELAGRRAAQYLSLDETEPADIRLEPDSRHEHEGGQAQEVRGLRRLEADATPLPALAADRPALILYTSGTTSRPKGVLATHANIAAQISTLVDAWRWTSGDRVLHVLPLNHVHGIVNVLGCALWAGACCEFLAPFDATAVWERFAAGGLTLFMAVPTIYAKLVAAYDAADEATRGRWAGGARGLRLMVSGSAALPVTLLARWRAITGHVLLERYGMTEIGMALSNPLQGPRRPGCVGLPLPGVQVRLVDEHGGEVPPGSAGEIEVRGPGVFKEYWRQPEATREAFRDGWFRTGDVAVIQDGSYRILGRSSVDIIKTGGYKVSALEIEEALREHPAVGECAVVGVPDEQWGERVAAAIVPRGAESLSLEDVREWAAPRLAKYKLPTRLAIVSALPRNPMGKVVKGKVRAIFQEPGSGK